MTEWDASLSSCFGDDDPVPAAPQPPTWSGRVAAAAAANVERQAYLPAEVEEGSSVEYKLHLVSRARLPGLVTQLLWRLREGGGQAMYRIGVTDDGAPVGLPREQMDASLSTLGAMAAHAGATISRISEVLALSATPTSAGTAAADLAAQAPARFVAEVRLHMTEPSFAPGGDAALRSGGRVAPRTPVALRVACLGAAGVGKSTLIAVLTTGVLDDGRGAARFRVARHRHEVIEGRTSSSGAHLLAFSAAGGVLSHAAAADLHARTGGAGGSSPALLSLQPRNSAGVVASGVGSWQQQQQQQQLDPPTAAAAAVAAFPMALSATGQQLPMYKHGATVGASRTRRRSQRQRAVTSADLATASLSTQTPSPPPLPPSCSGDDAVDMASAAAAPHVATAPVNGAVAAMTRHAIASSIAGLPLIAAADTRYARRDAAGPDGRGRAIQGSVERRLSSSGSSVEAGAITLTASSASPASLAPPPQLHTPVRRPRRRHPRGPALPDPLSPYPPPPAVVSPELLQPRGAPTPGAALRHAAALVALIDLPGDRRFFSRGAVSGALAAAPDALQLTVALGRPRSDAASLTSDADPAVQLGAAADPAVQLGEETMLHVGLAAALCSRTAALHDATPPPFTPPSRPLLYVVLTMADRGVGVALSAQGRPPAMDAGSGRSDCLVSATMEALSAALNNAATRCPCGDGPIAAHADAPSFALALISDSAAAGSTAAALRRDAAGRDNPYDAHAVDAALDPAQLCAAPGVSTEWWPADASAPRGPGAVITVPVFVVSCVTGGGVAPLLAFLEALATVPAAAAASSAIAAPAAVAPSAIDSCVTPAVSAYAAAALIGTAPAADIANGSCSSAASSDLASHYAATAAGTAAAVGRNGDVSDDRRRHVALPTLLSIDSVLYVRGAVVAAGLLSAGSLTVGDRLLLGPDPQGKYTAVAVASLHVHHSGVDAAAAGTLVAVRLSGLPPSVVASSVRVPDAAAAAAAATTSGSHGLALSNGALFSPAAVRRGQLLLRWDRGEWPAAAAAIGAETMSASNGTGSAPCSRAAVVGGGGAATGTEHLTASEYAMGNTVMSVPTAAAADAALPPRSQGVSNAAESRAVDLCVDWEPAATVPGPLSAAVPSAWPAFLSPSTVVSLLAVCPHDGTVVPLSSDTPASVAPGVDVMLHCASVRQSARVVALAPATPLHGDERRLRLQLRITLSLSHRCEVLLPGWPAVLLLQRRGEAPVCIAAVVEAMVHSAVASGPRGESIATGDEARRRRAPQSLPAATRSSSAPPPGRSRGLVL